MRAIIDPMTRLVHLHEQCPYLHPTQTGRAPRQFPREKPRMAACTSCMPAAK